RSYLPSCLCYCAAEAHNVDYQRGLLFMLSYRGCQSHSPYECACASVCACVGAWGCVGVCVVFFVRERRGGVCGWWCVMAVVSGVVGQRRGRGGVYVCVCVFVCQRRESGDVCACICIQCM